MRRWVTGPLFPNYLFARFDPVTAGRLVRYANGVTHIVSFGGRPAVVDAGIIAAIHHHAADDVVTVAPPVLRPGEVVEIQAGPLRGLQGIFERELSDRERVVILLDALAKGARVELTRDQLEKVG